MNVYTRSERADDVRLKNTTGADLAEGDVAVLGGQVCIANGIILINEVKGFGLWPLGFTIEGATADLKSGEDTFVTENQAVYLDPLTMKFSDTATDGYLLVGLLQADKTSSGIVFITVPVREITAEEAGGEFVMGVATLTAAAAATPVHVIAAAKVPAGKKFYLLDFLLSVGGATAWTDSTATVVTLKDTAASPVLAVSVAKAQLTSQAQLGKLSTGVTLQTNVRTGVGLTAAKGLDIVADAVFAAGSDITITAFGIVK